LPAPTTVPDFFTVCPKSEVPKDISSWADVQVRECDCLSCPAEQKCDCSGGCLDEDPDFDQALKTQALARGRDALDPSRDEGSTGPTSRGLLARQESGDAMPSSLAVEEQGWAEERLSGTVAPAGMEDGRMQNRVELSQILAFSHTKAGCRLVQREIETAESQYLNDIANQFRGHLWKLARCKNANYVLQTLINEERERNSRS